VLDNNGINRFAGIYFSKTDVEIFNDKMNQSFGAAVQPRF